MKQVGVDQFELYISKLIEEAVLRDIFTNLFCLALLLSISLATSEWIMVYTLASKLSTDPAFNLNILNNRIFTVISHSWSHRGSGCP
jgi:hypothetical protein